MIGWLLGSKFLSWNASLKSHDDIVNLMILT
jgi:hypothetical protein